LASAGSRSTRTRKLGDESSASTASSITCVEVFCTTAFLETSSSGWTSLPATGRRNARRASVLMMFRAHGSSFDCRSDGR
jgi:hypothetical protein